MRPKAQKNGSLRAR